MEWLDSLWYFGAFWRFVFSRRFRAAQLAEWHAQGFGGQCADLIEAGIAGVVGVAPVAALLWLLLRLASTGTS